MWSLVLPEPRRSSNFSRFTVTVICLRSTVQYYVSVLFGHFPHARYSVHGFTVPLLLVLKVLFSLFCRITYLIPTVILYVVVSNIHRMLFKSGEWRCECIVLDSLITVSVDSSPPLLFSSYPYFVSTFLLEPPKQCGN